MRTHLCTPQPARSAARHFLPTAAPRATLRPAPSRINLPPPALVERFAVAIRLAPERGQPEVAAIPGPFADVAAIADAAALVRHCQFLRGRVEGWLGERIGRAERLLAGPHRKAQKPRLVGRRRDPPRRRSNRPDRPRASNRTRPASDCRRDRRPGGRVVRLFQIDRTIRGLPRGLQDGGRHLDRCPHAQVPAMSNARKAKTVTRVMNVSAFIPLPASADRACRANARRVRAYQYYGRAYAA